MIKDEKVPIVVFTMDFETGGLDCQKCACTQIAIHAIRIDTFEVIDRLVLYFYPYKKQDKGVPKKKVLKSKYEEEDAPLLEYNEGAEKATGITMAMLEEKGTDIEEVAEKILDFISTNAALVKKKAERPFFIGQNIIFDIGFMQQVMAYTNNEKKFSSLVRGEKDFYGNFQPLYIDTIVLGQLALGNKSDINSWSLELLANRMGIENDDAHDADADVEATTGIARECAIRMRSSGGNEDSGIAEQKKEKSRDHFKI